MFKHYSAPLGRGPCRGPNRASRVLITSSYEDSPAGIGVWGGGNLRPNPSATKQIVHIHQAWRAAREGFHAGRIDGNWGHQCPSFRPNCVDLRNPALPYLCLPTPKLKAPCFQSCTEIARSENHHPSLVMSNPQTLNRKH